MLRRLELSSGGLASRGVTSAPKNQYVQADLGRWAAQYGVPLARHRQSAVAGIPHPRWKAPAPLTIATEISAVLARAGLGREPTRSMIDGPAMDERLENASEAAAARGDFGEPTIFVGDDVLFGNCRLHFVQDHRARAP